jgi:hypothetical protein
MHVWSLKKPSRWGWWSAQHPLHLPVKGTAYAAGSTSPLHPPHGNSECSASPSLPSPLAHRPAISTWMTWPRCGASGLRWS